MLPKPMCEMILTNHQRKLVTNRAAELAGTYYREADDAGEWLDEGDKNVIWQAAVYTAETERAAGLLK